jgi:hypothetical protein
VGPNAFPNTRLLSDLYKIAQDEVKSSKVKETLILTLATLSRRVNDEEVIHIVIESLNSFLIAN